MADYEIDEDNTVSKTVQFFKDPKPPAEIEKCPVDEAYLSAYEEMKADEKTIKDNLEIMNAAIKAARAGSEKIITMGKMAVFFTDAEGSPKVDWERLVKDLIGTVDKETLQKYTTAGKPSVRVVVKRLS